MNPRIVVLLGAPGVGKGTYAGIIAPALSLRVVSAGDLVRDEISAGSALGSSIRAASERGDLVPDRLITDLVTKHLLQQQGHSGFMLDGFPRTVKQAQMLSRTHPVHAVMNIRVQEWVAVEKLAGRRVCGKCKQSYNVADVVTHGFEMPARAPPISEDGAEWTCCGQQLIRRADDTPETIKNRLRVYHEETVPLLDFYTQAGILHNFDVKKGVRDAAELQRRIQSAAGLPDSLSESRL